MSLVEDNCYNTIACLEIAFKNVFESNHLDTKTDALKAGTDSIVFCYAWTQTFFFKADLLLPPIISCRTHQKVKQTSQTLSTTFYFNSYMFEKLINWGVEFRKFSKTSKIHLLSNFYWHGNQQQQQMAPPKLVHFLLLDGVIASIFFAPWPVKSKQYFHS